MTIRKILLTGTMLGAIGLAAQPAAAQTDGQLPPGEQGARITALNQQIQALQAQLKALEQRITAQPAAPAAPAADAPRVSVDNGRLRVRSADDAFDVALRARFHLDYGYWFPDDDTGIDFPDGFNARRAYIGIAGTVFRDWAFTVTSDFSGSRGGGGRLQEANVSYTGIPGVRIDIGALQPPFTLEDSTSANDIPFIERAAIVNLATSQVASEGRLAIGGRFGTDRFFAAAYLTGNQLGNAAGIDDQSAVIGRAAFLAFENPDIKVGVGATGGYLYEPAQTPAAGAPEVIRFSERPETRIGGGVSLIDTGNIPFESYAVYGADVAATFRNFWAAGEYYRLDVPGDEGAPDAEFDGWYLAAGWIITGEQRPYRISAANFGSPSPRAPFGRGGSPGAWELAARYSTVDLNDSGITGGDQEVWTFGANWYVNPAIRFMLNYQLIDVTYDVPAVPDIETQAVTGRLQFQF